MEDYNKLPLPERLSAAEKVGADAVRNVVRAETENARLRERCRYWKGIALTLAAILALVWFFQCHPKLWESFTHSAYDSYQE